MPKRKTRQRRKPIAGTERKALRTRDRRRVTAAVALVVCLVVAGGAGLAQWSKMRKASGDAASALTAQSSPFSPSNPSKEYVYAGGRLVATEEGGTTGDGQSPYGGSPRPLPGVVQAEDFDEGGEGVAYHDTDPHLNVMGHYRPASGVDIEGCGDAGGGFNVGWAWSGEWLEYTVNVAHSGTYTVETRVAYGNGAGGTFHVEFGGVDKTGTLTIPETGGWQTYLTVTKTGVSLTAGVQVMRLQLDSPAPNGGVGNFNYVWVTAESAGPAPTGLVATATSATTVALNWTAPVGSISHYVVERRQSVNGPYVPLSSNPTGTSFTDAPTAPGVAYLYRVRAAYVGGGHTAYSNSDLATTVVFADHPLGAGVTIGATHLNQLRAAVNAVRALAELPHFAWTHPDPVSEPAQSRRWIYLEDVQNLRDGIDPALTILGRYASYPTEPALVRYGVVSREHFMQIRTRVE